MDNQKVQPNPYSTSGTIHDPARFFGRSRELRFIFSRLANMDSVSVVGERRIGKSSLLYHIAKTGEQKLGPDYTCCYLDLQSIFSQAEFYAEICRQLGVEGNDYQAFKDELRKRPKKVVLCLDEFEQTAGNDAFDLEFFNVLRSLAVSGQLALVVATQHTLRELYLEAEIRTSPFFNIFTLLQLGPLNDAEARELVASPAAATSHPFSATEIDAVLEMVARHGEANHPFWLNLAASLLYDAKQSGNVDLAQIEKAFKDQYASRKPASATDQANTTLEVKGGRDTPPVSPSKPKDESVPPQQDAGNDSLIRLALFLAALGMLVGGMSLFFPNPIGIFFAVGLLLIALSTAILDWFINRQSYRRPR